MFARPKNTQAAIYAETGDGCSSSTVGCCARLLWLFLLVLPFLTMKLEMVMFVEAFVVEADHDYYDYVVDYYYDYVVDYYYDYVVDYYYYYVVDYYYYYVVVDYDEVVEADYYYYYEVVVGFH